MLALRTDTSQSHRISLCSLASLAFHGLSHSESLSCPSTMHLEDFVAVARRLRFCDEVDVCLRDGDRDRELLRRCP